MSDKKNLVFDVIVLNILNDFLIPTVEKSRSRISIEEFFYESLRLEVITNYFESMGVDVNQLKNNLELSFKEKYFLYRKNKPENLVINKDILDTYFQKELLCIFDIAAQLAFYKNPNNSEEFIISYTSILSAILSQKDYKFKIKEILIKSGVTDEKLTSTPELIKLDDKTVINSDNTKAISFLYDFEKSSLYKKMNFVERKGEINHIIDLLGLYNKRHVILTGNKGIGKKAILQGLKEEIQSLDNTHYLYNTKFLVFEFGDFFLNIKSKSYAIDLIYAIQELNDFLNSDKNARYIICIDGNHKCLEYGYLDNTFYLDPLIKNPNIQLIYLLNENNVQPPLYLSEKSTVLHIRELNKKQVQNVISNNILFYEEYYNIKINKSAIKKTIELTSKYFVDQAQPMISLNIIDRVGSKCNADGKKTITEADIEEIISVIANIPVKQIKSKVDDMKIKNILNLKDILSKNIIGQEEAITKLSDMIMIAQSGIANNGNNKPIASFMFTGTTGVGKTELAKNLSKVLNMSFLRLDMSEYSDKHYTSSLIGSPPGYINYESGGILTNFIKENPSTVILLDEIEKSHQAIYNLFLQILDYGILKNNKGEQVDFSKCILIFTSNSGAVAENKNNFGFLEEHSEKNRKYNKINEFNKFFSPEFRNRLDDIIFFKQLNEHILSNILELKLDNLILNLKSKNINISFDKTVKELILKESLTESVKEKLGARPLERNINKILNKQLAELVLKNTLNRVKSATYNIAYKDDKLMFQIK